MSIIETTGPPKLKKAELLRTSVILRLKGKLSHSALYINESLARQITLPFSINASYRSTNHKASFGNFQNDLFLM